MGVQTETIVTNTCDDCKQLIPNSELYINAMTYGCSFHIECFKNMSAFKLVKLMGLDDVKRMKLDDWEGATKIYALSSL